MQEGIFIEHKIKFPFLGRLCARQKGCSTDQLVYPEFISSLGKLEWQSL